MFRLFFKKEYQLEELIFEYIDTFKSTKNNFINALQSCLQSGYLCEDFGFYLEKTNKFESRADDIRGEMNNLIYGQALIPDSRGDVMETVGKRLVRLDPFSGLIVVLSLAMTMHAYAVLGVSVSSSQAVIGGVLGVGLIKGMNTISKKTLFNIFSGWILSPLLSCLLSLFIYFSLHLKYIPPTP